MFKLYVDSSAVAHLVTGWTVAYAANGLTLVVIGGRDWLLSRFVSLLQQLQVNTKCLMGGRSYSIMLHPIAFLSHDKEGIGLLSQSFITIETTLTLEFHTWCVLFVLLRQDYAKTDGLEYICPNCSLSNSKRKSQKVANGLCNAMTLPRHE